MLFGNCPTNDQSQKGGTNNVVGKRNQNPNHKEATRIYPEAIA